MNLKGHLETRRSLGSLNRFIQSSPRQASFDLLRIASQHAPVWRWVILQHYVLTEEERRRPAGFERLLSGSFIPHFQTNDPHPLCRRELRQPVCSVLPRQRPRSQVLSSFVFVAVQVLEADRIIT
ncbi:uncharacterized protein LOC110017651 [Oryzias latipes]